jgi:AcrR family transcriptional regulator
MAVRLTRQERSEQTRAELVEAARRVFLERGFHGASLDDISLAAGYTTGAVYSRFGGKDALFLAVLDDHIERRLRISHAASADAPDYETAGRQLVRAAVAAGDEEPGWTPLLMEFWTHAARDDELRQAVVERNERQLEAYAELHEGLAERHGATFRRPVREILRAVTAMSRGFGLERRIAPGDHLETVFEDYAVALVKAFTETRSTS